ncbi:MAG TPA: TRAP transporter small permease subunit [Sphingomonadales bacterium]|nr:TRAP transporter small permease subunit [Sphingomonadales bacterium]
MGAALKLANALTRFVAAVGKAAAYLSLALLLVILADVILRRYFVIGSAKLQELEWHLHGLLFLLCLGYGYAAGAHVRIEVWREKWRKETRLWAELLGIVFFLLPFTLIAAKFSFDYAALSFVKSEVSASLTGLSYRWFIKSMVGAGLGLLFLAGLGQGLLAVLYLFGPKALRAKLDLSVIAGEAHPKV